jgi:hypothetical protein
MAAAFVSLAMLILFVTGALQVWHLYVMAFIAGTFQGFQWPAYSAAIARCLIRSITRAPTRCCRWWGRPLTYLRR